MTSVAAITRHGKQAWEAPTSHSYTEDATHPLLAPSLTTLRRPQRPPPRLNGPHGRVTSLAGGRRRRGGGERAGREAGRRKDATADLAEGNVEEHGTGAIEAHCYKSEGRGFETPGP
jgi:hypothetical protein